MLAAGGPDGLDRKRQLREDLAMIRTQKAEVLTRIQALAKKARTGPGAAPPAPGASIEARRAALADEQRRRLESLWSACSKIMVSLLGNQRTRQYFGAPVDATYAPGYYTVIKTPMDLGTIKTKLDQRRYEDVQAFRDDVRLVFSNCRTFNPPGNFVRNIGDQASEKFEKRWAQAGLEAQAAAEARRAQLEREALEAELCSLPDAVRAAGEELAQLARKAEEATAAGDAPPAAPGPHRDMTFEEKRRLSQALGALPGERIERVLAIVAEGPSRPSDEGAEEFELDVDALDRETLWKLQSYADAVAAEQAAKQPPAVANGAREDVAAKEEAGNGAERAPSAPAKVAQADVPASSASSGSHGGASEGVGSRGDDAGGERRAPHDPTTFISATGPAPGQPSIVRAAAGNKKEVQLRNPNAWAALSGAAAPGEGTSAREAEEDDEEEEDNLWTEFQGRAQRASEEKAAVEAAERAVAEADKAAAEERAAREREAEEAAQAELEAKREADAAQLQALQDENSRAREVLGSAAAAGAPAPDLAALGLAPRQEDSDDDDGADDMEEL
ncbi:hypothetical protein QBZ16_002668 [Prototheca wickerhamii]|uniref:Uncharacterized protein n=1 Tax=Prototheca wickerhamii TaxID=3111 RepID=A0AAD9MM09_PROWI|nr:hypothetical protein QBZ16_002668 [Prototheca wickerhamii]